MRECASLSPHKLPRDPRVRLRVVADVTGVSMVDPTHAEAADINYIVERFARSGSLPPATREAQYMDCTGLQADGLLQMLDNAKAAVERLEAAAEAVKAAKAKSEAAKTPEPVQGDKGTSA